MAKRGTFDPRLAQQVGQPGDAVNHHERRFIIAASTVAVPLATMPAREWNSAGSASGTSVIFSLPDELLQKVCGPASAPPEEDTHSRDPNSATASSIVGRFIRTSFTRLPGHQRDPVLGRIEL